MKAMLMTIKPGWGKDTPAFRQLWTARFMPEADMEMIRWFNELQRVSGSGRDRDGADRVTRADRRKGPAAAGADADAGRALPGETSPCPFEGGREIASMIPNARFLPLESNNHLMLPGEPANDVLLEGHRRLHRRPHRRGEVKAQSAAPSGLVTILFTDMEGSTAITQQLGDDRAQDLVRQHNTAVRDALKAHAGNEIKHTGDGIMASFASARGAVDCAVAIQRALAAGDAVRVRIGLNAGEPVAEEQDLYGTSVQLAARVCAEAERRRDPRLERRPRAGSGQRLPLQRPRRPRAQRLRRPR